MLLIALSLLIIKIGADSITIGPGVYSLYTYTCFDKYITFDLQYSSNNGNVRFLTSDSCALSTYYTSLSTDALSYYSGTLSGLTDSETVCLSFFNTNLIQTTTITYILKSTCGSIRSTGSAESGGNDGKTWGIVLFIVLPIVLGLICCCVCIRYLYKRANNQPTFVRIEQQHQILPLQIITPTAPSTQVIKIEN